MMNRRGFPYTRPSDQPMNHDPVYSAYYNQSWPNQTDQSEHYPQEHVYQQTPFDYYSKPIQPESWPYNMQQPNNYQYYQGNPNMYQQQQNPNPTPTPGLLTQFQTADGQIDVQKMLSTVGQLANTVQQVSPVIKEIGAMIRVFR